MSEGEGLGPVEWSYDFLALRSDLSSSTALGRLQDATQAWVVVDAADDDAYFVYRADVLLTQLAALVDEQEEEQDQAVEEEAGDESESGDTGYGGVESPFSVSIGAVLNLDALKPTLVIGDKSDAKPIAGWATDERAPYVLVTDDQPEAVGVLGWAREESVRGLEREAPVWEEPATDDTAGVDEGNQPIRYPSIAVDRPPVPSVECTYTVDLKREASAETDDLALEIEPLDDDWEELRLAVHVFSPQVDFEKDEGEVTVRRNADSIVAEFSGKLNAGVDANEEVKVLAKFYRDARYCGATQRTFKQGVSQDDELPERSVDAGEPGGLQLDPQAKDPDFTVHISRFSDEQPNRLRWHLIPERMVAGLPARLKGESTLGQDPAAEATRLFKSLSEKADSKHTESIEGFGSQLWERTPEFFKKGYWALWDEFERPLNIQFITDEPALPWELMRPAREQGDDYEVQQPLALQHNVARWLESYEGYMTNKVETGRIYTISPKYQSVSVRLARAQEESDMLVTDYSAQRVTGTRDEVTALLRDEPDEQVSILHFAGHGSFDVDLAPDASIKLEDGEYTAGEVSVPEVKLGRRCHTLVFLNACETGMASSILGQVGGWADAFLGRKFGGFVAPLWAVEDMDAKQVASDLVRGIVVDKRQISEVMRDIRATHGNVSPAFYSYLYYGDVTAQIR